MKGISNVVFMLVFTMYLSACGSIESLRGCPDAEISWIDMVMIQDIKYEHHFPEPAEEQTSTSIEKGKELGKVTYKMAGNACSNHKMKNGDAAFIEVGTPIYEIKGYPADLVVAVDDRVFVADSNSKAKTAGELLPMEKVVKNIYIESTEDGNRLHTFSQASIDKFLSAWGELKIEDNHSIFNKSKMDGQRIFVEVELKNGVSFRQVYWSDSNSFHNGIIGNKEIEEVIHYELSNME